MQYARRTRRGPTPGPAGTREDASLRRSREGGGGELWRAAQRTLRDSVALLLPQIVGTVGLAPGG